jgi:hypothetical protein
MQVESMRGVVEPWAFEMGLAKYKFFHPEYEARVFDELSESGQAEVVRLAILYQEQYD